jgi:hypothetical protein
MTNMTAHSITRNIKAAGRIAMLAAIVAAPLFVVQKVNAGTDTLIGEAPTMSNGAGLVLLFGLQRS